MKGGALPIKVSSKCYRLHPCVILEQGRADVTLASYFAWCYRTHPMADETGISKTQDNLFEDLRLDCRRIRFQLVGLLQHGFDSLSSELSPILKGSSNLLGRAAEVDWKAHDIDQALIEVTALEATCRQVERLLRGYQEQLHAISQQGNTNVS